MSKKVKPAKLWRARGTERRDQIITKVIHHAANPESQRGFHKYVRSHLQAADRPPDIGQPAGYGYHCLIDTLSSNWPSSLITSRPLIPSFRASCPQRSNTTNLYSKSPGAGTSMPMPRASLVHSGPCFPSDKHVQLLCTPYGHLDECLRVPRVLLQRSQASSAVLS